MTAPRTLLLALPLALGLVQPLAAKQRPFAKADVDGDGFIDPAEFAGKAKGKAWTAAVLDFAKRDTNGDSLLSPAEYDPSKPAVAAGDTPPAEPEALPVKWTNEVILIWRDGEASKGELKSFNALLKKATPVQRQALQSYWDAEQAAAIESGNQGPSGGGPQGSGEGIAGGWAQTDPGSAAGWVNTLPADRPLPEDGYQNIINGWAQADPGAAAEWIADQEGESRELPEGFPRPGRPTRGEP